MTSQIYVTFYENNSQIKYYSSRFDALEKDQVTSTLEDGVLSVNYVLGKRKIVKEMLPTAISEEKFEKLTSKLSDEDRISLKKQYKRISEDDMITEATKQKYRDTYKNFSSGPIYILNIYIPDYELEPTYLVLEKAGYTEKDLIDADVQKTYAQNMGTVANGAGGGSLMGDMFGAMANMKVAGTMMEKMDDMLGRASSPAKAPVSVAEKNTWECACGEKENTKKFCMSCGAPKPEEKKADGWSCACGEKNITSKFCPECGAAKPAEKQKWNCVCGKTDIESKFCPECGAPRPEKWDCACGKTGIESKFCPECGNKKGE
jgi:hypothetical protein